MPAHQIAPHFVKVDRVGYIPQYAPTLVGDSVRFDPATDCNGYFTSSKFQAHNNCYNYGVDTATNTIAQPGRMNGITITGNIDAEQVVQGARLDGLILVGGPGTDIGGLRNSAPKLGAGHFVALLIAPAAPALQFDGDYHWVRCDDLGAPSWSQKDGPDQVTNFDFAGSPIHDPAVAHWSVNSGPPGTGKPGAPDLVVTYQFHAYMFVPRAKVIII